MTIQEIASQSETVGTTSILLHALEIEAGTCTFLTFLPNTGVKPTKVNSMIHSLWRYCCNLLPKCCCICWWIACTPLPTIKMKPIYGLADYPHPQYIHFCASNYVKIHSSIQILMMCSYQMIEWKKSRSWLLWCISPLFGYPSLSPRGACHVGFLVSLPWGRWHYILPISLFTRFLPVCLVRRVIRPLSNVYDVFMFFN